MTRPIKRREVVAALQKAECVMVSDLGGHTSTAAPAVVTPRRSRTTKRSPLASWVASANRWPVYQKGGCSETYDATTTREGRWWVVDLPDIGVTQGRSTCEAERMAADLVAIMLGIPVEQVSVNIDFRLSDELTNEVYVARQAQKDADKAQRQAADRSRAAIRHTLATGLSKQDAARVLGISAQRVSQLVPGPRQT